MNFSNRKFLQFHLYSSKHQIVKKEKEDKYKSNLAAFWSNISKFKSDGYRSELVKRIMERSSYDSTKLVSSKILDGCTETVGMSRYENRLYHSSPTTFDEEPEGIYIVYDGTCEVVNR